MKDGGQDLFYGGAHYFVRPYLIFPLPFQHKDICMHLSQVYTMLYPPQIFNTHVSQYREDRSHLFGEPPSTLEAWHRCPWPLNGTVRHRILLKLTTGILVPRDKLATRNLTILVALIKMSNPITRGLGIPCTSKFRTPIFKHVLADNERQPIENLPRPTVGIERPPQNIFTL